MNAKLIKALNEQVTHEFNAATLYLSLSLAMEEANYKGFAAWLRLQFQEEMEHALKFIDFLQRNNESVELSDITARPSKISDPMEAAKSVLEHEKGITKKIHDLYGIALKEKDYSALTFLNWFIDEQVEEEESARELVEQFEFAGESRSARMFLDSKLGSRK